MSINKVLITGILLLLTLAGCASTDNSSAKKETTHSTDVDQVAEQEGYLLKSDVTNVNDHLDYTDSDLKTIYFAGGCFWGVEAYMKKLYGVYQVTSGYANGDGVNPSYEDVITGDDGFVEAVRVKYDPERIQLDKLIDKLFIVIDPTSLNKQGNDVGEQYRTGIYYDNETDASVVKQAIKDEQTQYKDDIVTEAEPLKNFYRAEDYHQDYLKKNPNGYCHIDLNVLNKFAVDPIPKDEEIVKSLSKEQ